MPPANLHIVGLDPGGTTGWARLTVPRLSLFGDEPGEILDWEGGEITGSEPHQTQAIARLLRQIQSLDYLVGPATAIEGFDVGETVTTDSEILYSPIRIAAMLRYAEHRGETGDAVIIDQSRGQAKKTATDDRLKVWDLYDSHSGDHTRDAMRHAVTLLRRAKASPELRNRLWPELGRFVSAANGKRGLTR